MTAFESISVEFAGAPGTGKSKVISALVKQDKDYTALDYAYKESAVKALKKEYPLFSNKLFSFLLNSCPLNIVRYGISRISGLNSRMIIRYSKRFPDSLSMFERLAKNYPTDTARTVSTLNMIQPTIDKYMITEKYWEDEKILLIDEGFVQRGGSIFTPPEPSKDISKDDVVIYSKKIPLPDILILLRVEPEIAESRLKKRSGGYHSEYGKLNKKEMIDRIQRYDRFFDIIYKELRSRDVKVIEVNAERDIHEVVEEVDSIIKKNIDIRDDKIN